jgi:hypothetical protein
MRIFWLVHATNRVLSHIKLKGGLNRKAWDLTVERGQMGKVARIDQSED